MGLLLLFLYGKKPVNVLSAKGIGIYRLFGADFARFAHLIGLPTGLRGFL